jgi:hypothetical protein
VQVGVPSLTVILTVPSGVAPLAVTVNRMVRVVPLTLGSGLSSVIVVTVSPGDGGGAEATV